MFRAQLRTALLISWLIVAAVLGSAAAAPFLLSPARIASLTPVCEWKARYHRECLLCGMTTGFILISQGRFGEAERRNRGSVPLYAAFCANALAAGAVIVRLRRKLVYPFTEELSCRS